MVRTGRIRPLPLSRIDHRHEPEPEGEDLDQHDAKPEGRYRNEGRRQRQDERAQTREAGNIGQDRDDDRKQDRRRKGKPGKPDRRWQVGRELGADGNAGLQRITEITGDEIGDRVDILQHDRTTRIIGGADIGDLLGAQTIFRVLEFDQHRIAGHCLQQHEGKS